MLYCIPTEHIFSLIDERVLEYQVGQTNFG